jgi:Golgi nucleoside diphosphatase
MLMVIACILKTFKVFYYLNKNYRFSVNQELPTEVSLDQKWINYDIKRK